MGDASKAPERDKRLHLAVALASIEQARTILLWLYELDDAGRCADRLQGEAAPKLTQAVVSVAEAVRALRGVGAKRPAPPCIIGEYCGRHGFIHGAEAEELRHRIEQHIADSGDALGALQGVLDSVDARDSAAWLEHSR